MGKLFEVKSTLIPGFEEILEADIEKYKPAINNMFLHKDEYLYSDNEAEIFSYFKSGYCVGKPRASRKLYINSDYATTNDVILVSVAGTSKLKFYIVSPVCSYERLNNLLSYVHDTLGHDIQIVSTTPNQSKGIIENNKLLCRGGEFEYVYIIEDKISLEGSKWRRMRNCIKQARKLNPVITKYVHEDYAECIEFLDTWLARQRVNDRYGRPSVGRDRDLVTYYDKHPDANTDFLILRVGGRIEAMQFNIQCKHDSRYGVNVLQKTTNNYSNLGLLINYESMKLAHDRGVIYQNQSGDHKDIYNQHGVKTHKLKWHPDYQVKNYTVKYKRN